MSDQVSSDNSEVTDSPLGSDEVSQKLRKFDDLINFFAASISQYPNIFGGADIYAIGFKDGHARAGALSAPISTLTSKDGTRGVERYVVILPPEQDIDIAKNEVCSAFSSSVKMLLGYEEIEGLENYFQKRFFFEVTPNFRHESAHKIVVAQPDRTAIIILEAAKYRSDAIAPYLVAGAKSPQLPEDVWAPQLHGFVNEIMKIANTKPIYVAFDVGMAPPKREDLLNLLMSIEGCGLLSASSATDIVSVIADKAEQWDLWIEAGNIGRALNSLDELPPEFDQQKNFLRVQLLHKAALYPQALQELRQAFSANDDLPASANIKLARIAVDANAKNLAKDLVQRRVNELTSQEDLEAAYDIAYKADANELEAELADRLKSLFPDSPGLRAREWMRLRSQRDYASLAGLISHDPASHEQFMRYSLLDKHLSQTSAPDYKALMNFAKGDEVNASALRIAAIEDAFSRRLTSTALELAIAGDVDPSMKAQRYTLLVNILETLLLTKKDWENTDAVNADIECAVILLIEYLASHPTEQFLRARLVSILQPSIAGTYGLALIAKTAIDLAARPLTLQKRPLLRSTDPRWLIDNKEFLTSAFEWLGQEQFILIGRLKFPEDKLTVPPEDFLSAVVSYLSYDTPKTEADVYAFMQYLAIGVAIAPYAKERPDFDLELMRLAGGKLALAGFAQQARDLAEQILTISGTSSRRNRLSWFAMADIYHRTHDYIEALVAIACTLSSDSHADEEEAYHEAVCLARLLRDSNLFEIAMVAIGNAQQILDDMGLSETFRHQLDTLKLQIRHRRLSANDREELAALIEDTVKTARDVAEKQDQRDPILVMLAQLLQRANHLCVTIPDDAIDILGILVGDSDTGLSLVARALRSNDVAATDILACLSTSGSARYSDDVGYDVRNAVILASSALSSDTYLENSIDVSFALEVLSDRGVAIPMWDEAATPPLPPKRVFEPSQISCEISRNGVSVVQLGWDSFGRMVRVSSTNGELSKATREPENLIHQERYRTWLIEFPYRYGTDEDTTNLFYTTTADLTLGELPQGPTVIVADTSFQGFPPNLLYIENDFAGRTRPMATAPSLAWLKAARDVGPIGDDRFCAWIPTDIKQAGDDTLAMVAKRLDPVFKDYGFDVNNDRELPANFANSSLAIVTAHGSVHPEGHYFQVVSDEGYLRASASDLANSLRNVKVVILFVCSAGRADKHPGANTVIGLSKQILDRGCAAVIASPWPLDARVPSYWLPTFMDRWTSGQPIIQANFEANQAVDRDFRSNDPSRSLALTVFGNPFVMHAK